MQQWRIDNAGNWRCCFQFFFFALSQMFALQVAGLSVVSALHRDLHSFPGRNQRIIKIHSSPFKHHPHHKHIRPGPLGMTICPWYLDFGYGCFQVRIYIIAIMIMTIIMNIFGPIARRPFRRLWILQFRRVLTNICRRGRGRPPRRIRRLNQHPMVSSKSGFANWGIALGLILHVPCFWAFWAFPTFLGLQPGNTFF